MEQDDLVRLVAELKVIRDANSDGLVIMDWDRFFKLSQKNLITAVDEITKLINKYHIEYVHDGKINKHEAFTSHELMNQRERSK